MKYNIIYLTLAGGKFLGQIMTTGLEKCNKEYFDLYDNNDFDWMSREDTFHYNENLAINGTHNLTFQEIKNLSNLIFVSTSDKESKNRIFDRNRYISTSMRDMVIRDLKIKYHDECLNYLKENLVNFFEFKHINLWRYNTFLESIEELERHFNLSFDRDILKYGYQKWIKSNMKQRGTLNDK